MTDDGYQSDDDRYLVNIFTEYPFSELYETIAAEALINVRDLMIFSQQFATYDNSRLIEEFPDLYFESERQSPADALELYRRMAHEVLQVLESEGNNALREDVRQLMS